MRVGEAKRVRTDVDDVIEVTCGTVFERVSPSLYVGRWNRLAAEEHEMSSSGSFLSDLVVTSLSCRL